MNRQTQCGAPPDERCPGKGCRGSASDGLLGGGADAESSALVDDLAVLDAVHAVVDRAVRDGRRAGGGRLPRLDEFRGAPFLAQLALLVVFGEASLLAGELTAYRLKEAACAISEGRHWHAQAELPSYAQLRQLRSIPVTPVRCGHRGCRAVLPMRHPLPDLRSVRCERHPIAGPVVP